VGQTRQVEGYGPSTYGDRFADVYDEWYAEVSDAPACVARVADLVAQAGGGPVLELGVGSGRLAVPLADAGLEVHGIDASARMLRQRPGGDRVRAVLGDMAELDLGDLGRGAAAGASGAGDGYAVVLAAFNTLFNIPSEEGQRRCLAGAAACLSPTGRVIVESFVPDDAGGGGAAAVEPRRIALDEVVLSVSRVDRDRQTVTGQHVQITEAGIKLRPWHLRWSTPGQLDGMAAAAGLVLDWRHGGWVGEPFDEARSVVQVACYRRSG
jgi:SAM-dependent methyltransferase